MTYSDSQAKRDAAYAMAYRDWVSSLSPSERAALKAGGLCEPDTARHTSTHKNDEIILNCTAAHNPTPNYATEQEDEAITTISDYDIDHSNLRPTGATTALSPADVLASFCARIRAHPNPLLAFDAACFASGLMGIEGLSQSALAKRHGVTRAAFSKLVIQWADLFALNPSRGMRSKHARRAYRKARLKSLSKLHEQSTT